MKSNKTEIVREVAHEVNKRLEGAEGGHDWWHIHRVWQIARIIAKSEPVDMIVVELSALLHDIADAKFHGGDEEAGPREAREILKNYSLETDIIEKVINIVQNISFKNSFSSKPNPSIEFQIVQDADRLDAIGAIGIARAFNYGGFRNRPIFDPEINPERFLTGEDYKNSNSPTINHFYEKLLLLKDKMNTDTGKKMASARHTYMEEYLERFNSEWNCET